MILKKILLFFTGWFFISCSVSSNIPETENRAPTKFISPNVTEVYVDMNGSFFPPNWKEHYGLPSRGRYFLQALAKEKNRTDSLRNFEEEFLEQVQRRLESKERLFILIHGFNNEQKETRENYRLIREMLVSDPQKDEFINFNWDGLTARGVSGLKAWSDAVGSSQVAGQLSLRKILNVVKNKKIYIITHSRGASVALSALTNPCYHPKFKERTNLVSSGLLEDPAPLQRNGNEIKLIFIAPAIGLVDFKEPADQTRFIKFDNQVKSFHITVNRNDNILRKYLGFLSHHLSPTDLGYRYSSYYALKKNYNIKVTNFSGSHSHNFRSYIDCNSFEWILEENGLEVKKI